MFTDGRTDARTNARTPDRPVYYKLTFEPSAQVSLKESDVAFSRKITLKSGIFSLLTKCVFLGTSPGHVQVYHSRLKKYFSSSRPFLDKIFVKNNHHLDFMQGFISTSGVNTAFFHPKMW